MRETSVCFIFVCFLAMSSIPIILAIHEPRIVFALALLTASPIFVFWSFGIGSALVHTNWFRRAQKKNSISFVVSLWIRSVFSIQPNINVPHTHSHTHFTFVIGGKSKATSEKRYVVVHVDNGGDGSGDGGRIRDFPLFKYLHAIVKLNSYLPGSDKCFSRLLTSKIQ